MSIKKAFIWVSGLRFIDKIKLLMARNFFRFFTENSPVRGTEKTNNIPDVNWLTINDAVDVLSLTVNHVNVLSKTQFYNLKLPKQL